MTGDAQAVRDLAALPETRAIVHNDTIDLEPDEAVLTAASGDVGWNVAAVRANCGPRSRAAASRFSPGRPWPRHTCPGPRP